MKKTMILNLKKVAESKNYILVYFLLKALSVLILIIILPSIFERSYFLYNDFEASYSTCNINSPNGFYSLLVCALNIDRISDVNAIFFSVAVNTAKDLLLIYIVVINGLLKKKNLLFFIIILAVHPYLGLYHAKFSTTAFASFGVILMYYVIITNRKHGLLIDFLFIALAGFRNSLASIFLVYYLIELFSQPPKTINNKFNIGFFHIRNFIALLAIIFIVMLSGDYITDFSSSSGYALNSEFFVKYLNDLPILIREFIAFLLSIIFHLLFLLGFREQAFIEFPDFFIAMDAMVYFYIISGIFLAVIHGLGFFYFLKLHISKDKRYIIFTFMLIPTLFTVAHLRYFTPFIPLSLLGFGMFISRIKK